MAANFISKDEVSQNIVNAFIQRRLQHVITTLKRLETATARHRATKKSSTRYSSIGDEYSVQGHIKGLYIMLLSPLYFFDVGSRYFFFLLLLYLCSKHAY